MRMAFALLVFAVLFFQLLPLDMTQHLWAGPDMLLAFACAWALRRPEYVPSLLLAGLFLLADFLLFRPPGLWAALALLGCEHLKGRARSLRDGSFLNEWLSVCAVLAFVAIGYRAVLTLTLVELPGFGLSLFELAMTALFYPIAVAITHFVLRVRKTAPGELDPMGGSA
jgi:rod shape-determining protein MreD